MYALGTFISVSDRSDQANNIDLGVGMMLASVGSDGSPLVRKVSIKSLQHLVIYETWYFDVTYLLHDNFRLRNEQIDLLTIAYCQSYIYIKCSSPCTCIITG